MKIELSDLTVGDKVFVDNRHLLEIKRLTKTQIILSNGEKYRRATGQEVGGDAWHSRHIQHATEEKIASYRANQIKADLVCSMKKINFNQLTLEQLTEIRNIIEK